MRDTGIPEGHGHSALDWIGGLAKEALEQLASLRAHKAGEVKQEHLDHLLQVVSGDDGDDAAAVLRTMIARQLPPEAIANNYIPEAARTLGRHWEEDRISFVEVTVWTARLQAMLHEIDDLVNGRSRQGGISVLVLVPQGEQHTLGAYVLASGLRRAGHVASIRVAPTAAELTQLVQTARFDLALVSVACTAGMTSATGLIKTLRLLARAPLRVLVGGAIAEDDQNLLEMTGADAVCRDVSSVIAEYAPAKDSDTLDRGDEIKANRADGIRFERGQR